MEKELVFYESPKGKLPFKKLGRLQREILTMNTKAKKSYKDLPKVE